MHGIAMLNSIAFILNVCQQLSIFRYQLTIVKYMTRLQFLQAFHQQHICNKARCNRSQVFDFDFTCRIIGSTLNSCYRIHTASNGIADYIIHMSVVQNIIRFAIIRTEAQVIEEFHLLNTLPDILYILCDGAVSGIHIHCTAQLFQALIRCPCFMTGIRTTAQIGRQHPPADIRCMSLHIQSAILRNLQNIHHTVLTMDNGKEIHNLRKSDDTL